MKPAYHTALGAMPDAPEARHFALGGNVAICHDARDPLPPAFDACDVFYGEPPWRHGYGVFNRRAGLADARPFESFVSRLDSLARSLKAPLVYVVGRRDSKLYRSDATAPTRINGASAVALYYRSEPFPGDPDAEGILQLLAGRYVRVGDFLAGCGRAGRIFASRGKAWTLSDYNPRSIGHIAANAHTWASCVST